MFDHLFIKKRTILPLGKAFFITIRLYLLSVQSVLSSTWQGDTRGAPLYWGAEECSNNLFNCLDPQETTLTKV